MLHKYIKEDRRWRAAVLPSGRLYRLIMRGGVAVRIYGPRGYNPPFSSVAREEAVEAAIVESLDISADLGPRRIYLFFNHGGKYEVFVFSKEPPSREISLRRILSELSKPQKFTAAEIEPIRRLAEFIFFNSHNKNT